MDVIELYLYAGLGVGIVLGRLRPSHGRWVGRATFVSVVALVAFLGASMRAIAPVALAAALPGAFVFVAVLLAATTLAFLALRPRGGPGPDPEGPPVAARADRLAMPAFLLLALSGGYLAGHVVVVPTDLLIPAALAILLGLVGYGTEFHLVNARHAWLPISSAALGAVAAAVVLAAVTHLRLDATLATALGFGWYSLTGPLVAARLGAGLGLFAFLVNFLREGLTMLLAPYLGPRLRGEGLAALGGATAMDTTLYFIVRYSDRRAGPLALASGLTLTIAASLIVPLVLVL